MNRFYQPSFVAFICLQTVFLTTACLPGESDVAERYNRINQRAQVENTGLSLMQAANAMTAYQIAKNTVRKAPLDDIGVTQLRTIPEDERPEPVAPEGIKVVACKTADDKDKMGALAYFVAQPKGIAPLRVTGATMAKALAERFGSKAVGMAQGNGQIEPPDVSERPELDCHVENDILPFSPIFASGFEYAGYDDLGLVLADTKAGTWPTVKSDFTMPCPSGLDGVVKRERVCQLRSDEKSTKTEKTKVKISEVENEAIRSAKEWVCDPEVGSKPTPTAEEIEEYCRDPNDGLTKQSDNIINMRTDSLKKIIEEGAGEYAFNCRQNSDGTNSCDAKPYTPNDKVPKDTFMRCDKATVPEQYVINPILPIEVDGDGKVRSSTPAATKTGAILGNSNCGQGWTGDLIAGYQVRACRLIKVVNGVETPLKLAQTIYRIGYVGARCNAPSKEGIYDCPRPFDGDVILREANYMTKPLALQLGPAPAGEWSPSTIPYLIGGFFGNANAETKTRAKQEDYIISNRQLQGVQNPTFSSRLESAMRGFIKKEITGCKLLGQTCELPPDPIKLGIVFDRSGSMVPPLGPDNLTSATARMECQADLGSIFTDQEAACALLRDNARDEYPPDGRMIESVLGEYLIDRTSPVFNNMMMDAVTNKKMCGELSVDVVGYCKPTGTARQSSCTPGQCVTPRSSVTGTYLAVAEEQLQVAINYIPPGSQVHYTEYVTAGPNIEPVKFFGLCNYVTDQNCDYAAELNRVRNGVLANRGRAEADTPLMKATQQALQQFGPPGPDGGILLYFTDGAETDGIDDADYRYRADYPYPYGSLCNNKFPPSDVNGDTDAFCRSIGLTEHTVNDRDEDEVLDMMQSLYSSNGCSASVSSTACNNIRSFYDSVSNKLSPPDNWKTTCGGVGTSSRESVANYIKNNYPNLRVFILNLGDRELANCPRDPNGNVRLIDVDRPGGYKTAFEEAFNALSSTSANPQDVCRRVRLIYKNAADY